jgi:anti-sigma regulatory factor (Ser/Thr protein kinase)
MGGEPGHRGHPGELSSPVDPAGNPGTAAGAELALVLEQDFDRESLYRLRAAVAAHALHLGLSPHRAEELVIIVHELAANAVRHGAGHGRVRIWKQQHTVHCQVSDDGTGEAPGALAPGDAGAADGTQPWPVEPGHGLWVIRKLADQAHFRSSQEGSVVAVSLAPRGR